MAKFVINNWKCYEIDFHNYGTESEKKFLSSLSKYDECITIFMKDGVDWVKRSSGMTFRICLMNYYPKLKEYLDNRLNIHLRKEKLQKINEFYEANK